MITRLKLSSIEQGLPKYRSMLAGNTAYDPAATWLIATATGTGSSNTITFSSIPSTYQHLQIRCLAKDANTGAGNALSSNVVIQFNSDTASNYTRHNLGGDGSTAFSQGSANNTSIRAFVAPDSGTSMANIFCTGIIDIHDYASSTKYKTVRTFGGVDGNGSGTVRLQSGLWMSTNAITSISLINDSYNWTSTTKFALYGFKG